MNLGNESALWFLFVVPVVIVPAYLWCFWRKAGALRALAHNEMLKQINTSVSIKKQVFFKDNQNVASVSMYLKFSKPIKTGVSVSIVT